MSGMTLSSLVLLTIAATTAASDHSSTTTTSSSAVQDRHRSILAQSLEVCSERLGRLLRPLCAAQRCPAGTDALPLLRKRSPWMSLFPRMQRSADVASLSSLEEVSEYCCEERCSYASLRSYCCTSAD